MSSTSEAVDKLFNFTFKSKPGEEKYNSLSTLQQNGVASLWDCLTKHHIALLADEVGLGKTFQALAICAMTWKTNPHARILIIAPNSSILEHWMNEYEVFCRNVYRTPDDKVTTILTNEIVNPAFRTSKLEDLKQQVSLETHHLFLLSMYAFSTIQVVNNKSPEEYQMAGRDFRCNLANHLNEGSFDLLIIDEAHYFRNIDGNSNRVNTSRGFFDGLAKNVLLMTATPNHSRENDIESIFSYFDYLKYKEVIEQEGNTLKGTISSRILSTFALRRLKQINHDGVLLNKYAYRKESVAETSFETTGDLESELFFALYQRQLARYPKTKGSRSSKQFQLGYLEGLESIPSQKQSETNESKEKDTSQGDWEHAPDSKILGNLVSLFGKQVKHPKLDTLANELKEHSLQHEKSLVFVRRIPSVKEITKRMNSTMDIYFIEEISAFLSLDTKQKDIGMTNLEQSIQEYLKSGTIENPDDYEDISDDDSLENGTLTIDESDTSSQIFSLFLKTSRYTYAEKKTTTAFDFMRKLTAKSNLLSLLFEPAKDHKTGSYTLSELLYSSTEGSKKNKPLYLDSCRQERAEYHKKDYRDEATFIFQQLASNKVTSAARDANELDMEYLTFWSILYSELDATIKGELDSFSIKEKEAFAKFFKKGILYASPVRVLLYMLYLRYYSRESRDVYQAMIGSVQNNELRVRDRLHHYFTLSIQQFRNYYHNVHIVKDSKLVQENWNEFNATSPALFCSGNITDRSRIIRSFNSPFYPDVVVSTSVLQEGVSLHLNCRKIYHYGLPGNSGSWEQRVGRLDRNDSLIHRKYTSDDSERLDIYYPYLSRTYDEDQLKFFIQRNNAAKKQLDSCEITSSSNDVNMFDPSTSVEDLIDDSTELMHKGEIFSLKISLEGTEQQNLEFTDVDLQQKKISNSIKHAIGVDAAGLKDQTELPLSTSVFDPLDHQEKKNAFASLSYIPELSGLQDGCYYCLSIAIPIGDTLNKIKDINSDGVNDERDLYDFFYRTRLGNELIFMRYPSVQLCDDPSHNKTDLSRYLFRVDIPVFENFIELDEIIKDAMAQLAGCYQDFNQYVVKGHNDEAIFMGESKELISMQNVREVFRLNNTYQFLRFHYNTDSRGPILRTSYQRYNNSRIKQLLESWDRYCISQALSNKGNDIN